MLTDEKFDTYFGINNNNSFNMLVDVVRGSKINNLEMFSIAGKIAKYVEEMPLYIRFSSSFKIE